MEEIVNQYRANKNTKITCVDRDNLMINSVSGRETIKMDLIRFLCNSSEDFGLNCCKSLKDEKMWYEQETIGTLYGNWYDKKERYGLLGHTKSNSGLTGTFSLDNVNKRLLYNRYGSIPTYDFGKINHRFGLITESNLEDIIYAITNNGYRIINAINLYNEELNIRDHPKGLELIQELQKEFHKQTGKSEREVLIIGTETTLQNIIEKKHQPIQEIDSTKSVENIVKHYSKSWKTIQ